MNENEVAVEPTEPNSAIKALKAVGPSQILLSSAAVLSVYVLGLVFIYLDLVYERLGAAGAQPSLAQSELWPRALFWGSLHTVGVAGLLWSFGLARYAQGRVRGLGVVFGVGLFAFFLTTGALRLPSVQIVVVLIGLWPLASLSGTLARRMRRRSPGVKDDENLSPADARRVVGLALGLLLLIIGGLVAQQAASTVTAIRADRRPDNFFMILPVRRVNVTLTDDRVANGLGLPPNTPVAATLLGQREGRLTLLLRPGRRVIDIPAAAAVLASRG